MQVVTVTPTRGDRSQFLNHMKWMMERQTRKPDHMIIVDDKPLSEAIDITWRYKIGIQRALELQPDLVIFIEDDDYYAPTYIENVIETWERCGKPDLLGVTSTIYYNLAVRKWRKLTHNMHSGMLNTACTPAIAKLDLGQDDYPFTDIVIWQQVSELTKCLYNVEENRLSIGIKHGIGLTGGVGHDAKWKHYTNYDNDLSWLRSMVDDKSFEFYKSIITKY